MAYNSNILLYLNFDSSPIVDAIGNTVSYTGSALLEDGIFGNSYKMKIGQKLSINALHSLSQKFSMLFWLKSNNEGIVTNKILNENGCSDIYTIVVDRTGLPNDNSNGTYLLYRTGPLSWEGKGGRTNNSCYLYSNGLNWKIKIKVNNADLIWTSNLSSCPPISGWSSLSGYSININKTNASKHTSLPIIKPVVCKSSFNQTSSRIVSSNSSWIVYEITKDSGKNQLVVILDGLDGSLNSASATLTSTEYKVGDFHHFCIIYDGNESIFQLYLDGVQDNASIEGTIPVVLNTNSDSIEFNSSGPGFISQVAQNTGLIDDFAIFNNILTSSKIQRAANLGVQYVADDNYSNLEEIYQSVIFDDPNTAQITSVYANRGNLFVAREDGKLLRGVRTVWESRKEFANSKELDSLNRVDKETNSELTVSDGKLIITNQVIRI